MKIIHLPDSNSPDINLQHVVELSSDRFVVCYANSSGRQDGAKICLVDRLADDTVLRSFSPVRPARWSTSAVGLGPLVTCSLIRLAVCGLIFAVDVGLRRVLKLAPTLDGSGVREVVQSAPGNWPFRIELDQELYRLYVAENRTDKDGRYCGGNIRTFSLVE